MSFIRDIKRWRTELELAKDFRDKEFGEYDGTKRFKVGENIDYFEKGFSLANYNSENDTICTTLNFFHVLIKLIVPTLWFQNPRVIAFPNRKVDEDSAVYAREILNHFYRKLEVDFENELVVWDGYVLNRGIYKIGYATKFGMDIEDEKKKPSVVDRALQAVGLQKKKEEEIVRTEINQKIVSESPYIKWVSPFKFRMDPRARTIDEAMWVSEEFEKTLAQVKKNPKYKNTSKLKGENPNNATEGFSKIPDTEIEEFKVVKLHQIQYINNNKYYDLIIAEDGDNSQELYHEERIYDMDGFNYDILEFNRHGHVQFKRSDLTKIKNLQDRFTSTIDSILEQVDRFVPKVAYKAGGLTPQGLNALKNGGVGAVIECTESPDQALKEIAMTQLKQDLRGLLEEMVNIITIMTGITKTKLLGVSSAETATGESAAAGGESIRMSDMKQAVERFANRQASKLWQIIAQFVNTEELELITGESGVNPKTGAPQYTWLDDINSEMANKLSQGKYRFSIEVGSTQKVDNAVLTKRIENLIGILARTDVIALMQQQGKKVDLAEILRLWLQNNPEIVRDSSRIIQDVTQQTQGLLPAQEILTGVGPGGVTEGSNANQVRAQGAQATPTPESVMQEAY